MRYYGPTTPNRSQIGERYSFTMPAEGHISNDVYGTYLDSMDNLIPNPYMNTAEYVKRQIIHTIKMELAAMRYQMSLIQIENVIKRGTPNGLKESFIIKLWNAYQQMFEIPIKGDLSYIDIQAIYADSNSKILSNKSSIIEKEYLCRCTDSLEKFITSNGMEDLIDGGYIATNATLFFMLLCSDYHKISPLLTRMVVNQLLMTANMVEMLTINEIIFDYFRYYYYNGPGEKSFSEYSGKLLLAIPERIKRDIAISKIIQNHEISLGEEQSLRYLLSLKEEDRTLEKWLKFYNNRNPEITSDSANKQLCPLIEKGIIRERKKLYVPSIEI